VVYGLGFPTLFFRNYYESYPNELIRAAQIDGASFFQIFRRLILPTSGPIIVVTVIFQFTNIGTISCSDPPSPPANWRR
jgi:glucose/mannose transport system permease protein